MVMDMLYIWIPAHIKGGGIKVKTNTKKLFKCPEFGYYDENGVEHVNWKPEDEDIDSDGFDKHNVEENGDYKQDFILPHGKYICRYGNIRGRLTTDFGTDYEMLSLPYVKNSIEYHVYKVVADGLRVKCTVQRGRVAPMFDSLGGAIQYKHYQSIAKELDEKKIKEVFINE